MKKIFEDYRIIIMQDEDKHYIQYDAGELVDKIDIIEVSKEDAEKVFFRHMEQFPFSTLVSLQKSENLHKHKALQLIYDCKVFLL